MWTSLITLPSRWCLIPTPTEHHDTDPGVSLSTNTLVNHLAILDRRHLSKRHQQRLLRHHHSTNTTLTSSSPHDTTTINPDHSRTTISQLNCSNPSKVHHETQCYQHQQQSHLQIRSKNARRCNITAGFVDGQCVDCSVRDTGLLEPVSDLLVTACVSDGGAVSAGWVKRLRVQSDRVAAGWRFLIGVVFVLETVFMLSGVRRFLARLSGRRRWQIPLLPQQKSSLWRILAVILVYSSLTSLVDGCSSRNTPKPRPPPTPATAAATTARPNITFLTYECPPAYAAWYCLNGATCFTVKIGDSLLYNCECSEGYMGPRCEYKDLDGSYLPSQRRILLETASIAGGATIAVLLVVVLGLVAYVHYCRRQRKEEPPTPPPQLTAAQSTLTTTTTDTVDGVTRTVTTSCGTTQVPRRLPTFGTRWKAQNQQQPSQHSVAMTQVHLQQVTTLLGDCEHAQTQQTHAQQQRQC